LQQDTRPTTPRLQPNRRNTVRSQHCGTLSSWRPISRVLERVSPTGRLIGRPGWSCLVPTPQEVGVEGTTPKSTCQRQPLCYGCEVLYVQKDASTVFQFETICREQRLVLLPIR
jgi:hypothetical protein